MHTIRLRAAWVADGPDYLRRFHSPTGLDAGDRVWLALDAPSGQVTLNGQALELGLAARADVTERLRPTNELRVATDDQRLLATVRLEIESAN